MRARVEPLSSLEYLSVFTAGWSSLVARRAVQPTLMVYTMAYTDG